MKVKMTKRLKLKYLANLNLAVIWVNWAFKCVLWPIILRNLRVAWSTGSWAGAGCAELRQRTGEQVYMLEKCHRCKKSMRRKSHLVNPPFFCRVCGRIKSMVPKSAVFNGVYSLLLASHSAWSTPGGSAVRAHTSVCGILWHTYCCCRYGRSSRLLLLIPLGKIVQS